MSGAARMTAAKGFSWTLALASTALVSCVHAEDAATTDGASDPGTGAELEAPPAVEEVAYGAMEVGGRITHPEITESSGLAASRRTPGGWWTHNDSGDTPRLFLLDERGELLQEYRVDVPRAIDWEDMCSFELDGRAYLLVGDIGDNARKRSQVTLWLIPEPAYDPASSPAEPPILAPVRKFDFAFAQGPQDCESLAFDPVTRTVMLITKVDPRRNLFKTAGVYLWPWPASPENAAPSEAGDASAVPPATGPELSLQAPRPNGADGLPAAPEQTVVLERDAKLSLRIVVGADVAADGSRCVVATYGDAWTYARQPGQTWAQAFSEPPKQVALGPRGQSEAVAFAADGVTVYLTAEGVDKPLWRVAPEAAAAGGPGS
ncbi:MAG: hypothetical protein AAGG38_00155 [Planctomycetota bacterium]